MVALTEGWYFDGVALRTLGRMLETGDGLNDTPPVRGDNVTLLGRHGVSWRRKRYDTGRKTLTLGVHGCLDENFTVPATGTAQRALYEEKLDDLLRLISPRTRLIEVERVYADGQHRTAMCEVLNPITPATLGDTYGRVQFELVVPGSFWRDKDARPYRLRYDVAGADAQDVEVYSLAGQTAPCSDAVTTITGPCTSVEIRDKESGSGFAFGALALGQTLVVDPDAFSVELDGASVLADAELTLYDSAILEISPAPTAERGPLLTVTAPGKAAGFSVVVEGRRSWLR